MIRQLRRQALIDLPLAEVFPFFADAANLEAITPPELSFRITSPLPITMQVGALIDYRLQLFGISFNWQTLISEWQPPHNFVDEQLKGPYRLWRHRHSFSERGEQTEMVDVVDYQLPFWPFGELAAPLVQRQLERIFDYRQERISQLLK